MTPTVRPPSTKSASAADQDPLKPLRQLAEQNKWEALEAEARYSLLSAPEHRAATLELLAYSLQQQGHLEAAVNFASEAAELSPSAWLPHFVAGVALKGLGRAAEACVYLRQAAEISPTDQQTLLHLVEAATTADGIDSAASEYETRLQQTDRQSELITAPILSVRNWAKKSGLTLFEAGEIEDIPYKEPHVFGTPVEPEIFNAPSNKPYVADINNVRIFGQSGIILTADGCALSDIGGHPQFGQAVSFAYDPIVLTQHAGKALLDLSKHQTREIESGIFMSGLASNAFGHWLPEFLPKLQFLQKHPDYDQLPVIVDANMPQSHIDHLRRLCSNPLIELQANECLLCHRLLVAPSPAFSPVELYPNDISVREMPGLSLRAMRFLQGGTHPPAASNKTRRLFLARKTMQWRRLINESEIAEDLSELGFEVIFMETMSTSEQIELFQQADIIVAPNGSALLNLIFADTKVKLLVLTQPNLFNWGTFQGPMDALGYQSMCVSGEYAVNESEKHSDYRIQKQKIRQALSEMGVSEAVD